VRQDDYPLAELDLGPQLLRFLAERPPRWWFHGLLAVPTLGLLWAATQPGGGGDGAFGWALLILLFAVS
jgi:hypothetical protein